MRRFRRSLTALVALAIGGLFLAFFALTSAGTWLVVEDPLQPSYSVVVLGGHLPFRAMEAAAVYRQGWAREVWLTQGHLHPEDVALAHVGVSRAPEHEVSLEVLEHLGVPRDAIRVLPEQNWNSADEVRAIAEELRLGGGRRVILITSKYHTRRVKVLWRVLAESHLEAVVRYTPNDPFEPRRWWRTTDDAMSVSREWGGLFNVWMGFPMKSER